MTEDEMVGWHHRCDGHEFEDAPGVGDGQGSLECYSPRGCKDLDVTEQVNNNNEEGRAAWRCPRRACGHIAIWMDLEIITLMK